MTHASALRTQVPACNIWFDKKTQNYPINCVSLSPRPRQPSARRIMEKPLRSQSRHVRVMIASSLSPGLPLGTLLLQDIAE
jgi:hypothetical protein